MGALQALLHFAENTQAKLEAFDGADVSPASLAADSASAAAVDSAHGGLNLRDRNLSGASLRSANLTQANLTNADLSDSACAGIELTGAHLEGAQLCRADLAGGKLKSVNAGEANFCEALLEDAVLTGAQLRFADFGNAILDGADLSGADLWGAKLRNAAADRAVFRNARLDESSLANADLAGADFSGATLRRADLSHARLQNANLRDALLDGANLAGANLSGASLPNLSLSNCSLANVRFAGAWLDRTRMQARQLQGSVGEEAAGDLQGALDSYIVLERNFESLGSSDDASWAYLRRRRVGRKLHAMQAAACWKQKQRRSALVEAMFWLGDLIAEWLCDYGESLFRVARAFLVILIVFAVLYWLTGSLRQREAMLVLHPFTPVNYLIFSLDSMTTVGTSEVALRPKGELGTLLSSLQTVIGTVLLGLFGFVLGARIRK
ncbi:pentapeptide repeat-containing protein [Terriglobus sp.]|uniref:pentapeptide repeat-containing protein n=1 Tax=Terriglobus sp. TaxID=1889013 RepID=UPI003AFFF5A8